MTARTPAGRRRLAAPHRPAGGGPEPTWTPLGFALGAVTALVLGFAGTAIHRLGQGLPWGLVLAVVMVALGSAFVRAVAGRTAIIVYLITMTVVVLVLTYAGPGGDVLVTSDPTSMLWVVLSLVTTFAGFLLPRGWFLDHAGAPAPSYADAGPRERG